MESKHVISRKNFFKLGVGAAGGLMAAKAVAATCESSTPDQPLGPFFPNPGTPQLPVDESGDDTLPISERNDNDLTMVKGRRGRLANGQVVYVRGKVTDSECEPIAGASIVIWQASSTGHYNHHGDDQNKNFRHPETGVMIERKLDPNFQYWGRAITDANGEYLFKTIVPGFYPADLRGGWYRPPHIHFMISAIGYPQKTTQMYFKGREILNNEYIQTLNSRDYLLQAGSIPEEERKKLVAEFKREPRAEGDALVGQFDIQLDRS